MKQNPVTSAVTNERRSKSNGKSQVQS